MLQEDSLASGQEQAIELHVEREAKPQRPYQVLRRLPKDATPAQQDSAIQAVFHPREIKYSSRPDTLHLPGHGVGKKIGDVDLPQYYRQNFFSATLKAGEAMSSGRYGIAGDPVPYNLRNDNVVTVLLFACFIISVVSFARTHRFIGRQAKRFFRSPRPDEADEAGTGEEVRFQLFLVAQAALLLALFQYFYTQQNIGDTFILSSQYQLIAIFFGMWMGYFVAKGLLYAFVNTVFFGRRKNRVWLRTILFITAIEGVALLPVALLQVYFGMSMGAVTVGFAAVLALFKMLTFYKCYAIFFKRMGVFLQLFLYFCALEAIPLAALWGALMLVGNYLKINY